MEFIPSGNSNQTANTAVKETQNQIITNTQGKKYYNNKTSQLAIYFIPKEEKKNKASY